MKPPHQHSRINLAELKAQIIRKLGPERSKQYFNYLSRLLSLKLTKVEFNKLCLRIVGRECIPLHNQFIRSILKNACSAKVPPPTQDVEALKHTGAVEKKEPLIDGYQQNGFHPGITQGPHPPALSNGGILPLSPRKTRSGNRDRRVVDRHSALGRNGMTNIASQQSLTTHSGDFGAILENGDSTQRDIRRPPLHHHQEIMQQEENGEEEFGHQRAKLSANKRSPGSPVSVHTANQNELLVREDGKEASARSLLLAPLGIPFCPVSLGGACRALPLSSRSKCVSSLNNGGLSDTVTLRERVEQIAAAQGLEGVSMDCTNVLNNGLDAYLKGLIRSCVELVGARSGHERTKPISQKQQAHLKIINGFKHGYQYQIQSSSTPLEVEQECGLHCPISLLDFRVAMELNPQQLGDDWPLLLEKICTQVFED